MIHLRQGFGGLRSTKGFTLIEILLSIAILAVLAALAARSISSAVTSKTKIQDEIDDVSKMRDALRLIERDVNLAFHHRDTEKELTDLIAKQTPTQGAPGQPAPVTTTTAPREAQREDPTTNFMGDADHMDFVTSNNARMIKDARQADFIEVGYALKSCTSADGKNSSQCLWRRSSPIVDDDVTTGGDEVVLLENVTEFGLRYIGDGKQDWVDTWHTDKSGDATTKNNFPKAVEISLKVEHKDKGKTKKYSMQIVASIHFLNNPAPQQGGQNGQPTQTTTPSSSSSF